MTASNSQSQDFDFDEKQLRGWLAALCDENLSESEAQELAETLARSEAARNVYVRYMTLDAGLSWEITSQASVVELLPTELRSREPALRERGRARLYWSAAIAATLFVGATIVFLKYWPDVNRIDSLPGAVAEHPSQLALPVIAVAAVTEIGREAQWAVTPRANASHTVLREHDVVCVTEGEIQVTFDSGAIVTLYAPAMMEVLTPMKGRAIRGKLAADVGEGAEGFTIETPQATVVDLGTVFGVEVGDEGATDVFVFKGAVDLHFDGIRGVDAIAPPKRLTSGEAMRIDKGGTPSRIVSISSDRFSSHSDRMETVSRPVLISTVTDNIDRERENWNYYEIVHEGLQEDAKAFVDRVAHEWNGRDATGIPAFLLGGDYVKTFNNDKYTSDLELFVTIDHPCKLYILIDDRVAPPAWLKHQFKDTGVNIGLDVGPFYRVEDNVLIADRQPGVGPGVLVDETFSVWECEFDEPQIVHLGSIEADHRYVNMYGIVAVPLDPK